MCGIVDAIAFKSSSLWEALKPIHKCFRQKTWEQKPLQLMNYLDLRFRLPELLPMRVVIMSMGVCLEGRVPFLDHKVVELAMSIPEAVKTRSGNLKPILKKSVRGLIPDELIDRKKQGFGIPIHEWFVDRLGEHATSEIKELADKTDFINFSNFKKLNDRRQAALSRHLLNLALWWKKYFN